MRLSHRFATLTASALMAFAAHAAPKVGEAAPAFTLPAHDGKTHSLSDYKGKTVVLEWTNAECPFVKKHYAGNMQALQKTYTGKDVVWLSINSSATGKQGHVDAAGATKLVMDKGAAPTLVMLDPAGTVGKAYDAKTTPHMFVIDKAGTLVYAGAIDSEPSADPADIPAATPYVKNALDEVLAGKPVTNAVTKPYGCGVKYAS